MKRRQFLTTVTGATVTTAISASRILGANDRVRVGLIGCGNRGLAVAKLMREVPGVEFPAVCDVYDTNAQAARQWAGKDAIALKDFRKLLERTDIDAVLIATPDHWHAIPTVLACQAGKDVYVEKPLAHNVKEGRAMVEASRRHKRVVQSGVQHRSAPHYREVQRIIQSGELGDVGYVRVWNFNSIYPQGIGHEPDSPVPAGLDWDFYLGPAPLVPFNKARFLGSFRYFWDYAGGWITDFGTHRLDTVQQVMGVDAPLTVVATGGRFAVKDTGDMPDVLQVTYEYPRFVLSYETCTMSGVGSGGRSPGMAYYRARGEFDRPHGEAFYGTNGALFCDRIGYEIYPELKPGQRAGVPPSYRMERKAASGADATNLHVKNFIECVRSRNKPVADVEIGHRSTIVPHLGNISYRTGKKLYWEAAKEDFKNEPEASRLLGRKARKPWDLI